MILETVALGLGTENLELKVKSGATSNAAVVGSELGSMPNAAVASQTAASTQTQVGSAQRATVVQLLAPVPVPMPVPVPVPVPV